MITSNANRDSFHALNPNSNLNTNPTYIFLNKYTLKFNFIVLYFMFVHTCFIPASNIGWHLRLMLTFCVHSRIPSANIRSKFIRVSWITHPPFLGVFEERTTIKRKSLMVRRSVRDCIMRDISNHQISPYCILYFVILSSIILEYQFLSLILRNVVIAIQ